MNLMDKKMDFDMKRMSSESMFYYSKLALLTMGAFAIGRMTRNMMS